MATSQANLLAHLDASRDATTLSLAYASVGDDGCHAIARFLRDNSLLTSLDLRGNNLRADGIVILAHALQIHQTLKTLILKWNHVGSHIRGISALCDVLKENQNITTLDIRNNKIGADGAAVIADMLKVNRKITHLDLSWNDFGVEGGHALLEGLQSNTALVDCQLSGNRIAEDTLHAIAFLLRRNRTNLSSQAVTTAQSTEVSRHVREQIEGVSGESAPADLGATAATTDYAAGGAGDTYVSAARTVADEEIQLRLLQRERDYTNPEDARFFAEVAEYIDLLQLDVARNKKYRTDAEERERVVTKGFMEREMRYAQEMRELEDMVQKAIAEKEDLVRESDYLQTECERVKSEKAGTVSERMKFEEAARAGAERLRCDIRDALTVKADLETEIYKLKRKQQEQDVENQRLRTYLSRCKEDLDKALRPAAS